MPLMVARQARPKIGLAADLSSTYPSAAGPLAAALGGHVQWVPLAAEEPDLHGLAGLVRADVDADPGVRTLPITDPEAMQDPTKREHFVERVFAHDRLRALFESPWGLGDLVEFHTNHKLQLFSHDPNRTRALGRIVASGQQSTAEDLAQVYAREFTTVMATPHTTGRWVDVLQHAYGYLPRNDPAVSELRQMIESYQRGDLPLSEPFRRLTHLVFGYGIGYLIRQTLFCPIPHDLEL